LYTPFEKPIDSISAAAIYFVEKQPVAQLIRFVLAVVRGAFISAYQVFVLVRRSFL